MNPISSMDFLKRPELSQRLEVMDTKLGTKSSKWLFGPFLFSSNYLPILKHTLWAFSENKGHLFRCMSKGTQRKPSSHLCVLLSGLKISCWATPNLVRESTLLCPKRLSIHTPCRLTGPRTRSLFRNFLVGRPLLGFRKYLMAMCQPT